MKIGLIINPVAGLGGRVALKGSDGELAQAARHLGAEPSSAERARRALAPLTAMKDSSAFAGASGSMGERQAAESGLDYEILYESKKPSTSEDTIATARCLKDWGSELILFAGGDGTARDVMTAVGSNCPVLGIPAGVKMHSAVFARSPREAGTIAVAFASQDPGARAVVSAEVMDRNAQGTPEVFGTMLVPRDPRRMQPAKSSPPEDEDGQIIAACRSVADSLLEEPGIVIVGPGTTTFKLKQMLAPKATVLGVDIYESGRIIVSDASEKEILSAIDGRPARMVLGVIGGQGFLLGRGNQQISPAVIRSVGLDNILGLASASKLAQLPDRQLYADTGDEDLDRLLANYVSVKVGAARTVMMPLNSHLRRLGQDEA